MSVFTFTSFWMFQGSHQMLSHHSMIPCVRITASSVFSSRTQPLNFSNSQWYLTCWWWVLMMTYHVLFYNCKPLNRIITCVVVSFNVLVFSVYPSCKMTPRAGGLSSSFEQNYIVDVYVLRERSILLCRLSKIAMHWFTSVSHFVTKSECRDHESLQ